MISPQLQALEQQILPLTQQLGQHHLYRSFDSIDDLRTFMESHVFAVWDFMCLLKTLQRGITCVDVPWRPSALAESRRLINEIVFGEESDLFEGQPLSHFELYRMAMQQCGADTSAIDSFLAAIVRGTSWPRALSACNAPEPARRFVESTFSVIEAGKLHAIAAAFTFGREDLIPDMFRGFLRDQDEMLGGQLSTMRWYIERHIEVDGEEHGPMALRMVSQLCGDDPIKWHEATEAASFAITARISLWDGIANLLPQGSASVAH
ncbi:DUF3050 domain-containing protein [Granulicella arctica]|uniref:DUF3050 domain-containing protein n=1 Tax=Granulicella arctica TaxID=940613 RepID=UPI0021E06E7B|nr:DUF3050 domain-containing protein [Granulicella arctica]